MSDAIFIYLMPFLHLFFRCSLRFHRSFTTIFIFYIRSLSSINNSRSYKSLSAGDPGHLRALRLRWRAHQPDGAEPPAAAHRVGRLAAGQAGGAQRADAGRRGRWAVEKRGVEWIG